jgi:hypothetical protein
VSIYFVPPVEQTNTELKRLLRYKHPSIDTCNILYHLSRPTRSHVFTTFTLRSSCLSTSKSPNALAHRYILPIRPTTHTHNAILRQDVATDPCRHTAPQSRLTHLYQCYYPAQSIIDLQLAQQGEPLRGPHASEAQRSCAPILLLWTRGASTTTHHQGDGI